MGILISPRSHFIPAPFYHKSSVLNILITNKIALNKIVLFKNPIGLVGLLPFLDQVV